MWSPELENCQNWNPHISKNRQTTSGLSHKQGVEATTFLSRMQNLVKLGEEL